MQTSCDGSTGALARINEGSYGFCESCGQEIPAARLQAEPTALRCVHCQELYEKTHAGTARRGYKRSLSDAGCEERVTCIAHSLMRQVFICDAIRTPFGRYGGALAASAPTTSAAIPMQRS